MKILQVFDMFTPFGGGTVDVIRKLSHALAQKGHDVSIYTSDYKLDRQYINSLKNVKVYPFHCVSSVGAFYIMPDMIKQCCNHLKEFDVVHLHCARSFQNIVVYHYAKKYGIHYIMDEHGSLPLGINRGGIKLLSKVVFDVAIGYKLFNDATKVVTENKFGVIECVKFGIHESQISVIPLGLDINEFANLPKVGLFRGKYGIKTRHVITFVGRIHYIKGLDFLVESFKALNRKDVTLCIVGNDDGYLSVLESMIKDKGRVVFTGFLNGKDKLEALVDSDIFIQPSRYEQAAWASLEAVLCGTPIIVSEATGAAEEIASLNAGYAVKFGDVGGMILRINEILSNPYEAKEKANKARELIKRTRSIDNQVNAYENVYTNLV